MNTIKLNHWYINENELVASLMHFYVSINMEIKDNKASFNLRVVNSETEFKEILLKFSNLEDVISFVEDVVTKCWTFEEVINEYHNLFELTDEKVLRKEKKW